MSAAITVRGLGKRFRRYHPSRPATLQEAVLQGLRWMKPAEHVWALRGVSFAVTRGHMLGVIGANGAGKSTLLRLLGGIGKPDEGSVEVNGRVGALLDLGAGLHPDLTGRENAYITGVIGGLTRSEMARRFDTVVDFAELADAIDEPLRTYSSGMRMRLAFAVAAYVEPSILLVDEALAVGDLAFQRKCLARIDQLRSAGCTIVLVSHETALVQELCDEALWLHDGKVAAQGPTDVVVGQYVAHSMAETRRRTPTAQPPVQTAAGVELRVNENRFGSMEMQIVGVALLDRAGGPITALASGDPLRIQIEYAAPEGVESPIFAVAITREDGLMCYSSSTAAAGVAVPPLQGRGHLTLCIDRLDLNGGQYRVDVGAYERDWAYAYDYHCQAYPLRVRSTESGEGVLRPPARWALLERSRDRAEEHGDSSYRPAGAGLEQESAAESVPASDAQAASIGPHRARV